MEFASNQRVGFARPFPLPVNGQLRTRCVASPRLKQFRFEFAFELEFAFEFAFEFA